MNLKDRITEKFKKSTLLNNIVSDYNFRTIVFFIVSLSVNIIIAVFNATTGILYKSIWYGALAVYYIALALQRGALLASLYYVKKRLKYENEKYEKTVTKIYIINGAVLLLLQAALSVAIVQMVTTEKPAKTGMVIAIANAAYAFYKIIAAAVNLAKTIRLQNMALQIIRNINLADASVSMLALTSTLICTFGNFNDMRTMLTYVATGVSLVIIAISVIMIIKGALELRKNKQNNITVDKI